ncbi:hypothetical protein SEA_ARGAN_68 [Arthrobacter phage Argan]|nr:hypothetical protein SEA_ARGAN_68 [Arthrobacter phage Argan]
MENEIELIARVVHQANRVLQLNAGEESLSPKWDEAPEWQTKSSLEGVKAVLAGTATPFTLHELWAEQKRADGWVYGEVKDEVEKTHPCLVPYLQLPESQKIKDLMFLEIVKAFRDHKRAAKKCWACSELDPKNYTDADNCFVCGRGLS